MRRNRGLCVLVMAVFMFLTGCGSPSQAPTGRETGKETTGKTEQTVAQQERRPRRRKLEWIQKPQRLKATSGELV